MFDWLKRKRTARTLERRAIPDPLWRLTLARFPFGPPTSRVDGHPMSDPEQPTAERRRFWMAWPFRSNTTKVA